MFSFSFLNELRSAELDAVLDLFPPGCRVLEIGAGTGQQAAIMSAAGFRVTAIDLKMSNYSGKRVFPVVDYDGRTFPFADDSFDVAFSSNVLEHVQDLRQLHAEIKRVLVPGGSCVHIVPTHYWRFWTSIASIPAFFQALRQAATSLSRQSLRRVAVRAYVAICQPRHGERGNAISELWTFSPSWWRQHFRSHGFTLVVERDVGIFYTGEMIFGPRLPIDRRRHLAHRLGSACHVFKLSIREQFPEYPHNNVENTSQVPANSVALV